MQFIFVYAEDGEPEVVVKLISGDTLKDALSEFIQKSNLFDWINSIDETYSKTEEPERFLNDVISFIEEQEVHMTKCKFYINDGTETPPEVTLHGDNNV